MKHGQLYQVTYRTAVNRDWTKTETLKFTGISNGRAVFEDPHTITKPLYLSVERITALEEA